MNDDLTKLQQLTGDALKLAAKQIEPDPYPIRRAAIVRAVEHLNSAAIELSQYAKHVEDSTATSGT